MTQQEIDYAVDLMRAVLWQYDQAPALQSVLTQKSEWYGAEQEAFWAAWQATVFSLDTADAFGMVVWSKILGLPLSIILDPVRDKKPFGFSGQNENFFNSNFASSAGVLYTLTLEQKRLILKLRYIQLVSRGTVPEVNRFLADLFGDAYVLDGLNMAYTVVFPVAPTDELRLIIEEFDLLPRPAGVKVNYVIAPKPSFGFGPLNLNFVGNFLE